MGRRLSRLARIAVAAGAFAGLSAPAAAEGEPCLRDVECAEAEFCFEAVCQPPPEEVFEACDEAEPKTCEPDALCVDGRCKRDVPVCRNAVGACFVGADAGSCACASAPGIEWTGEPPDVGSQSKDPTGRCFDLLAAICPAAVPEPRCDTVAQRETCEAFVAQENALNVACGGEPNDDPARIAGAIEFCCQSFDDMAVATYRSCVVALAQDDCVGFEACSGGEDPGTTGPDESTGSTTEAPDDDGGGEEPFGTADSDDEAVGCRLGGDASGWLVLFALGWGVRRRRVAQ